MSEEKSKKRYYWLKLKEDFFEEKYVKALRSYPDGNALVVTYLKIALLSLKENGCVIYDGVMPTYEEELALALGEDKNIVKLTIEALLRMGAVEKLDNDTLFMIAIQRCFGSECDSAERVRKFRALQCNDGVTECNTEIEKENKRKEIEGDTENNSSLPCSGKGSPACDYKGIVSLFNSICVSLPSVRELTDKRKKAISGAIKLLDGVTFEELFRKVESSDFLTGRAGTWNGCGFDWIIKPSNLVKILEGNYTNKADKPSPGGTQPTKKRDYNESLY